MDTVKLARVRRLTKTGSARSIRLGAKLSLAEVADNLGVGVSTLWRWEAVQRQPRGEPALRYCDLLDELLRDL